MPIVILAQVICNHQGYKEPWVYRKSEEVKNEYRTFLYGIEDDLTILINTQMTDEMKYKHQCRLLTRDIQNLRKKIGLVPIGKKFFNLSR